MNGRFDIFMRSVDDDLLEEAQKELPRKNSFLGIAGLAACLCIIASASLLVTFTGMGASKSAECATEQALVCEDTQSGSLETGVPESDAKPHLEAASGLTCSLPLPDSAELLSCQTDGGTVTADFTANGVCFSLCVSENTSDNKLAGGNYLADGAGIFWELSLEDGYVRWYSVETGTVWRLGCSEDDGKAMAEVLKAIADKLGIEVPGEIIDVFSVK